MYISWLIYLGTLKSSTIYPAYPLISQKFGFKTRSKNKIVDSDSDDV